MKLFRKYAGDILACLVFAVVLYLFYRSFYAFILLIPFYLVYRKLSREEQKRRYREKLGLQFKDALISFGAALRAGYSVENAIRESYEEIRMMYGEDAPICREFKKMINQIRLGITAEKLFFDLAEESGVEDIETFASVFSIAKRTGGDMVGIIKKTTSDIAAKIDTRNEISVLITAKRFEQNIMNFVPLGIILYIGLTSGDMMSPLYGNAAGVMIMTACLMLYASAFLLSRKIMDIRV